MTENILLPAAAVAAAAAAAAAAHAEAAKVRRWAASADGAWGLGFMARSRFAGRGMVKRLHTRGASSSEACCGFGAEGNASVLTVTREQHAVTAPGWRARETAEVTR